MNEKKPAKSGPGLPDRIALWVVFGFSSAITFLLVVFGTISLVTETVAHRWSGVLDRSGPEELPPEAASGSAKIEGTMSSTSVTVTNLTDSTSAWFLAGNLLTLAIGVIVTGSVAYLAWRLLEMKPFASSLTVAVKTAGLALVVGSIVTQTVLGIAESELVYELNPNRDEIGMDNTFWGVSVPGDFESFGFGILLLLVAFAFQYGERLQRDTEGLV